MPRNLLAVLRGTIRHSIASCMSAFPGKRKAVKTHRLPKSENSATKRKKLDEFSLKVNPLAMVDASSEAHAAFASKVKYLSPPAKSENDKKEYRVLQLPNGMRVLLISDPNISESEPNLATNGVDNMGYTSAGEESCSDEEGSESDDSNETDGGDESHDNESESDDSEAEPDSTESGTPDIPSRKGALKEGDRMAAASLSIGVGSFSDPPDLPGLAHFLEHMVFMGSKKYPEENAFDEYLKIYGGSSNASTDCETTTFEFEIHQRYFKDALEIFTQFFASPLLLPESMKREKEAIDSEFQMALPSDSCRRQQLFGHLAKPDHPMSKFMWGNSDTLKLDNDPDGAALNQRVREFWQEHYTADRMTAVLQSKHSLDQLEEWATTIFREMPSNRSEPATPYCFRSLGAPFDAPNFKKLIKIVPVKDVNQVMLTWALPSQMAHYRIKPLGYLSWLIGHEGKGSLLAYLRRKVWALDLASGNDESGFEHNSTYASFGINISLTERGMAEIDQVIRAVFLYIRMLQEKGVDERIWNEIKAIEELSFRYTEDVPPVENVESLSENMHKFQSADYITGESLLFEFNPEVIKNCIDALKIDNVNIMISSKEFERAGICSSVEPWFQTKYTSEEIPNEWIELWTKTSEPLFAVPDTNQYLASDFSLIGVDISSVPDYPVRIDKSDDGFWLWHRPDVKFRIPKAVLSFYLISPAACETPKNAVLLELLGKILRHQLMEKVYDALVAQLELAINHYDRGLIIKVSGFNHKLHLLVQTIVDQFAKFEVEVDAEVFDALKEQQEKSYRNYCLKPSKIINDARLTLLHTSHWSVIEKLDAVKRITLGDMKEFAKQLKDTFKLECLCQGNYTEQQALAVTRQLKNKLQPGNAGRGELPPIRICQVPIGEKTCRLASFHPTDANSVVVNYYQIGATNMYQTAIMEILINLMEEPVFDVLRTREQLGYNVYATLRNTFGVLGFSITVDFQADKFSGSHVDDRIEEFLRQFETRLNAMTEDELKTRVSSLIKLKQVPDVSLDEEVSRNWNELLNEEYLFERLRLEIEHLPRVTLDEVRSFFKRFALNNGERRKLSMQVIGNDKKDSNPIDRKPSELRFLSVDGRECICDLNEFRTSAVIFPPLRTYDGLPTVNAEA